jgi:ATP-dependent Lon protease
MDGSIQVDLSDGALHALIETYCREAGVRNLQKHIERIYRKVIFPLWKHLHCSCDDTSVRQTVSFLPFVITTLSC